MAIAVSPDIHELSEDEGAAVLDRQAQAALGISGDEFRTRWEAGDYDDDPDSPAIMRLVMLLPLGR